MHSASVRDFVICPPRGEVSCRSELPVRSASADYLSLRAAESGGTGKEPPARNVIQIFLPGASSRPAIFGTHHGR